MVLTRRRAVVWGVRRARRGCVGTMHERLIGARYRALERLGSGGMASVWRALDTWTGRIVAIKRLHPHLRGERTASERLRREAAAMATLDHPNVVAVLGVVDDGGSPAMVMEHLGGETLDARLSTRGPLPEPTALAIALAVTEALAAAHAIGLVHRDVKPANILLTSDGPARLMDFGIAADLSVGDPDLTAEGVIGTLRYLAPERLLGEPAVPATDVWGVGVVLYEMLTGRAAYPGTTLPERIGAAGRSVEQPTHVSDATWAVIERAADGDPARRYPDGAALAAAVRPLVEQVGGGPVAEDDAPTVVVAVPDPSVGRPARPAEPERPRIVQRARSFALALGAIGLAGAVGLAVIALDPERVGSAGSSPLDGTPAPLATALAPADDTPDVAPAERAADPADAGDDDGEDDGEDDGDGKGRGQGNGKGKGHGKDKP
jgi:hypothetical protein